MNRHVTQRDWLRRGDIDKRNCISDHTYCPLVSAYHLAGYPAPAGDISLLLNEHVLTATTANTPSVIERNVQQVTHSSG
jgi:hypothetical protein